MIKHAYIHIPFCQTICTYCDFCKMFYHEKWVNKYLHQLEKEITTIYNNDILETIYIGGGTPSCLNIRQLEKLLKIITNFKKSPNLEFTIECNFENTTKEKLQLFHKFGVNRLSFGVETVNKKYAKFLGRSISKKQIIEIITTAKSLGFTNINVDLMYAFPNQTIKDIKKDLTFLFSLDINHISTYSLIIEKNTIIDLQNIKPISEDLEYEMYNYICKELSKNDFIHYEISNFSKKSYQSKHNICYWQNKEYYGFGLGASSYLDNKRITNTRSLTKYLQEEYVKETEKLTVEQKIEYELILNLRTKEGLNLKEFKNKYGIEVKDKYNYFNLLLHDLLKEESENLFIPEDKWYISNEIIVKLLEGEKEV